MVGIIVGLGVYFTAPTTYSAATAVELTKVAPGLDLNPIAPPPELLTIDSDAQMVDTDEVVSSVAKVTHDPTSHVRASLQVTARPLTRVLVITYTSSTAARATAGAQRAAETFLDVREQLVVKPLEDYLANVKQLTESPRLSAETTTEDLSGRVQSRVEGLRQRAMLAELKADGAGSVAQSARITSSGNRGGVEIPVVTGACLGALLGVGFTVARRYRRAAALSRQDRSSATRQREPIAS
jgi:hypothetical protein